tara:strand:- start:580 stop:984 length:405 start_codon:yes stop_codon:yes gene_type:complete
MFKNMLIGAGLAFVFMCVFVFAIFLWSVAGIRRAMNVRSTSNRSPTHTTTVDCSSLVAEEEAKCDKKKCNSFIYDWVVNKYWAFSTYTPNCKVNIKQCANCPHRAYNNMSGQIGDTNWVYVGKGERAYEALKQK